MEKPRQTPCDPRVRRQRPSPPEDYAMLRRRETILGGARSRCSGRGTPAHSMPDGAKLRLQDRAAAGGGDFRQSHRAVCGRQCPGAPHLEQGQSRVRLRSGAEPVAPDRHVRRAARLLLLRRLRRPECLCDHRRQAGAHKRHRPAGRAAESPEVHVLATCAHEFGHIV